MALWLEVDLRIYLVKLLNVVPLISVEQGDQSLNISLVFEGNRTVMEQSIDRVFSPFLGVFNQHANQSIDLENFLKLGAGSIFGLLKESIKNISSAVLVIARFKHIFGND